MCDRAANRAARVLLQNEARHDGYHMKHNRLRNERHGTHALLEPIACVGRVPCTPQYNGRDDYRAVLSLSY